MKLLYHHRIRSKDGQIIHVEELIDELTRLGHKITVVGPSRLRDEEFGGESRTLAWMKQHVPNPIYELLEFGYSLIDFGRVVVEILRTKPDAIYERFNLFLPSGIWASRVFSLPLLLEINAPLYEERQEYGGVALRRLARWSQEYTWLGATKCLPVTQVLADYILRVGVRDQDVVVMANGVNLQSFAVASVVRESSPLLPAAFCDSLVLGFVGFIRTWHGLEKILELVARRSNSANQRLSFLVIGDGPARRDLEERARELGVAELVHFTGVVSRDRIKDYISLFDIALQPWVVSYASPLKLFEYMAMGRTIVAPDVPNIREVLTDGINALLFDPRDELSMNSVISRLIKDSSLRTRLGKAARETILTRHFSWEQNALRITELLDDVV